MDRLTFAGGRDFKNKDLIKPKMSGPYHETVCTLLQFFSSTARLKLCHAPALDDLESSRRPAKARLMNAVVAASR